MEKIIRFIIRNFHPTMVRIIYWLLITACIGIPPMITLYIYYMAVIKESLIGTIIGFIAYIIIIPLALMFSKIAIELDYY